MTGKYRKVDSFQISVHRDHYEMAMLNIRTYINVFKSLVGKSVAFPIHEVLAADLMSIAIGEKTRKAMRELIESWEKQAELTSTQHENCQ